MIFTHRIQISYEDDIEVRVLDKSLLTIIGTKKTRPCLSDVLGVCSRIFTKHFNFMLVNYTHFFFLTGADSVILDKKAKESCIESVKKK